MSSYYLIFMIVFALLAVAYVWHKTRNIGYIADDVVLHLSGTDAPMLEKFFDAHLKSELTFDLDQQEIISNLLNRLYKVDVDPKLLVINEKFPAGLKDIVDDIYDLRSSIGMNVEVAVVSNEILRNKLIRVSNVTCLPEIVSLVNLELDVITKEYLKQILEYRWDKLLNLNNDNIINNSGSYLYLRNGNIPNVEIEKSQNRVNLLCTDAEFETLVKRLSDEKLLLQYVGV